MPQKQTPRQLNFPHYSGNLLFWTREVAVRMIELVRWLRNDLDNGAMTFGPVDIAGIGNVAVADFDEGQIRVYRDTSDSKVYLVTRNNDAIKKVELT